MHGPTNTSSADSASPSASSHDPHHPHQRRLSHSLHISTDTMEHAQAAPIDIPGPSSPRAAQVFPSDAVSASFSSSPTSPPRGSPEPSTSSSPGSTGVRHHVRSEKLLEAAHIDPREARWRCLGGEEGLQLDEEPSKSWSEDGHDDGAREIKSRQATKRRMLTSRRLFQESCAPRRTFAPLAIRLSSSKSQLQVAVRHTVPSARHSSSEDGRSRERSEREVKGRERGEEVRLFSPASLFPSLMAFVRAVRLTRIPAYCSISATHFPQITSRAGGREGGSRRARESERRVGLERDSR